MLANLESAFATEAELKSSPNNNPSSSKVENFDMTSRRLIQQQINFIARIEQALLQTDSNKMRTVGGQLITHNVVVESFLKRQYRYPQALCNQNQSSGAAVDFKPPLNPSNFKIYCSLYNSNRELSKLTPLLDKLLSRRGELALVRELPLVSGEKQSDLVLPKSPVSLPNLGKRATPFAILEPSVETSTSLFIGKRKKTALTRSAGESIAKYIPPVQPAIKAPPQALRTLKNAEQFLAKAISVFPEENKFHNPKETRAKLDRLTYGIDLQEKQNYKKLLSMPNTGIFRVLPHQAYLRPLNTVENRSQKNVLGRYPFPILGESKDKFTPNLPLQIVKGKFHILSQGMNYSFMVDIGDVPLEDLDASLQNIDREKRDILINYQPPKKLSGLQIERRKIITGKHNKFIDNQPILNRVEAKLNHTYLVRNLQFNLPEIIVNNQAITRKQRRYLDQLLEMESSDVIVAFRPIRRRANGSYTIIWRVLQELPEPQIEDLEDYLQYQK